jgi:outer membrane protein OmpA-like peptidoglycan-associated protein
VLAVAIVHTADAADARHCADAGELKRFQGSSIVMCEQRNFVEYTLPTGKSVSYDFDTGKAAFEDSLNLEGRLTQNVYAVPKGASAAEVFRNYQAELAAKGYTILFAAKQSDLGSHLGSYFEGRGPGTQIWGYSPDQARYLAAVKDADGAKTYLALYVIEYEDGYDARFSPAKGQVMVRLDAVRTGALEDRMAVASAAEISSNLASAGRAVLYGILFDFDSAAIKPESRPALDEIGKFLTENPAQNIYVIGHTDNVGGFDFNLRLSRARADAVVAALTRAYAIPPGRMVASGVGLQAPVASNGTEEGRAKNRRVELVPR